MEKELILNALNATIFDRRLSRSEKKGLQKVLSEDQTSTTASFVRQRAFQLASQAIKEVSNPVERDSVLDWLEDVIKLIERSALDSAKTSNAAEALFSPDDDCVHRIKRLLESSKQCVDICVFTITDDRIRRSIIDAHRRDVKIRIISDDDKSGDLGSDVDHLEQQGIEVRLDQSRYHMHHKFAIFDRHTLLNGSYNWTRSAAEYNEENFVISKDRQLCRLFQGTFDSLWQAFGSPNT